MQMVVIYSKKSNVLTVNRLNYLQQMHTKNTQIVTNDQ